MVQLKYWLQLISLRWALVTAAAADMMMMVMMMMMMVQRDEAENGRRSSSDESTPEEIDPKLLRKQLLEVSAALEFFRQQLSSSHLHHARVAVPK